MAATSSPSPLQTSKPENIELNGPCGVGHNEEVIKVVELDIDSKTQWLLNDGRNVGQIFEDYRSTIGKNDL